MKSRISHQVDLNQIKYSQVIKVRNEAAQLTCSAVEIVFVLDNYLGKAFFNTKR